MIYFIIFLVSIAFIRRSTKFEEYDRRKVFYFVLSGLVLILLAAYRSIDVGTDTSGYQLRYYEYAKVSSSFQDFIMRVVNRRELVYLLITYVFSKTGHIFWVFFANELFIIYFIYRTIWKYRDYLPIDIMLECFLVIDYCRGFNIVRQCMAMAVLLYGTAVLAEKKYIKAALLLLLSIGCHSSGIVGVGLYILYFMSLSGLAAIYQVFIIGGISLWIYFYKEVFGFVVSILSFLPSFYASEGYLTKAQSDVPILDTVVIVLGLILCLIVFYYNKDNDLDIEYLETNEQAIGIINNRFLLYMMIISLLGKIVQTKATFSGRIFEYFEIFILLVIPVFFRYVRRENWMPWYLLINTLFVVYFGYLYIYRQMSDVYPYHFGNFSI